MCTSSVRLTSACKLPSFLLAGMAVLLSGSLWAQRPFITVWDTRIVTSESTPDHQIEIPATGEFTYAWEEVGDPGHTGSGSGAGTTVIDFKTSGVYRVSMYPTGTSPFSRIAFRDMRDREKIKTIAQWGDIRWASMQDAFSGCTYLKSAATDIPDLSGAKSMRSMFRGVYQFNGNLKDWDVSTINDMGGLFWGSLYSNEDVSGWDVSNVTQMQYMFWGNQRFNRDISNWDVRRATDMYMMFYGAREFDADLSNWDVSNVTNMSHMFHGASEFNADIGGWDVRKLTGISSMFEGATSFNQYIGDWELNSLVFSVGVFENASSFNQDISKWNMSQVVTTTRMFKGATFFDQNLGAWNLGALRMQANIAAADAVEMFDGSGMSCGNYGLTLAGWAANPATPNDIMLGAQGVLYNASGMEARNALIAKGWQIEGDALDEGCAALPVKLVSFSADQTERGIVLRWESVSEVNAAYYDIERSNDALNFQMIGRVLATGTGDALSSYHFRDQVEGVGAPVYYRLRMVDTDGSFEFSVILSWQPAQRSGQEHLVLYPNPVSDVFFVKSPGPGLIRWYNAAGVKVGENEMEMGVNSISVQGFPAGFYLGVMESSSVKFWKK